MKKIVMFFKTDGNEWEKVMTKIIKEFTKSLSTILKLIITTIVNLSTIISILLIIAMLIAAKLADTGQKKKWILSALSVAIIWLLIFIVSTVV